MTMSDEIQRITGGEFDELIAFLDAAFGHDTPERSFVKLLPGFYRREEVHCNGNFAVRVDGRLAAVVGLFPITWRTPGGTLRIAGIGGVATGHVYRRGGLMSRLMPHVIAHMRDEGYPLSFLTGQRQRYGHFGYEIAGRLHELKFEIPNIRHAFGGTPSGVTLRPCTFAPEQFDAMRRLHDAQPYHCNRTHFAEQLYHWRHVCLTAHDAQGRLTGYAVVSGDRSEVFELVGADTGAAVAIVRELVAALGDDHRMLTLYQANASRETFEALTGFAEYTRITPSYNWLVLDWPTTLTTLLRARHAASPLMAGEVRLAVDGQVLQLTVDERGPRCEATTGEAALSLDGRAMTRLLLGPLSPHEVKPNAPPLLDAWCPLPLVLPRQDHV
jgi:predicted N-acetyltransferase YhbS